MYNLRSDKGNLIAEVDNKVANLMIMKADGHFEDKIMDDNKKHKCYVFDNEGKYIMNDGKIIIYIWKGYYLRESI